MKQTEAAVASKVVPGSVEAAATEKVVDKKSNEPASQQNVANDSKTRGIVPADFRYFCVYIHFAGSLCFM